MTNANAIKLNAKAEPQDYRVYALMEYMSPLVICGVRSMISVHIAGLTVPKISHMINVDDTKVDVKGEDHRLYPLICYYSHLWG